jgi:Methane oxygenase PmoA
MHYSAIIALGALAACSMFVDPTRAEITVEPSERGALVKIDGQLFTEYLTKAGQAPAMWPILGPTGAPMTRAYPVGPDVPGETTDHPHHQSLWFTHDRVNGADFWQANTENTEGSRGPHIAHREFSEMESLGATARIVTRNDWMDGDRRVCADERTLHFGTRPNGDRWIDFTIVLKATDGDVTFGDTKEGTFAVRVADSMRLEAKSGGRIVNSEGELDDEAWGLPARWVDYSGPVNGEVLGIAIMSHPASFRPLPRWHVRDYGLFTANPFGEADFPETEAAEQGAVTINASDKLTLRYRVLLHREPTGEAEIETAFAEFAAE